MGTIIRKSFIGLLRVILLVSCFVFSGQSLAFNEFDVGRCSIKEFVNPFVLLTRATGNKNMMECGEVEKNKMADCLFVDAPNRRFAEDDRIRKNVAQLYKMGVVRKKINRNYSDTKARLVVRIDVAYSGVDYYGKDFFIVNQKVDVEDEAISNTGRDGYMWLDGYTKIDSGNLDEVEGLIYKQASGIIDQINGAFMKSDDVCKKRLPK